jgi:hypothetical protein
MGNPMLELTMTPIKSNIFMLGYRLAEKTGVEAL